jgi:chromosome segregation ATPase
VDALEQEVRQMRDDAKDVHQAQIRVLNSLRTTQLEHGQAIGEIQGTLKEHGQAIGEIKGTLNEHGQAIGEIQGTLKEHGQAISGLRTEVSEIKGTLREHGRLLHNVGIGMAGIARSLDYLINEQGQSRS